MISSYKDLVVWQKGIELAVAVYDLTAHFPIEEKYGLTSQMRRCSISIPSNIAEGRSRGTRKDFSQFLRVSLGSASELKTQIEIARRAGLNNELDYTKIDTMIDDVSKMIYGLIKSLSHPANT